MMTMTTYSGLGKPLGVKYSRCLRTRKSPNYRWILKNSEINHVSIYISTPKRAMAKRMTALGSAHQIGLSTCLEGVLIVVLGSSSLGRFPQYLHNQSRYGKTDGRVGFSASNRFIHVLGRSSNCSWRAVITRLKSSEIAHVSHIISATRGAMANRMSALDSAHQIGLSTCLEAVLIVVEASSLHDFKKQRTWGRFRLYLHNQGHYGKTDDGIGFSASNRSIHVLG